MKYRIGFTFLVFAFLWLAIISRAAMLQLFPNERLQGFQKKQFDTVVTLEPRRGAILDRAGKELAVSVTAYSVFADPLLIENPKKVAKKLAKHLDEKPSVLLKKISKKKSRFVWLKRRLSVEHKEEIQTLRIRGIGFVEESKRIYPNGHLLSQVLGFVSRDGRGLEGIENKYNEFLHGEKRQVNFKKDARGRPLLIDGRVFLQKPEGSNVELTIDRDLQYKLEQELAKALEVNEAESAYGVILSPQTSEILAMASMPTYDPNQPFAVEPSLRRNRVVTDAFEPGSTMKTFAVASALHEGLVAPNTKYFCENGKMELKKGFIREANKKHSYGWLTVSEILAKSSNIGVAKIAFEIGAKKLFSTLQTFGFGEKSGVDMLGDAKGIVRRPPWRERRLATISFGHGIAVTPLQIANAYSAIANGGVLNKPYVVKRVFNPETGVETEFRPIQKRRVLTTKEAETLKLMLLSVTSEGGTGLTAKVPGFQVAGKTGTAQKVDPEKRGYMPGAYIASFAGMVPASNPKFVIYVAIDNPQKSYYGSQVAGPVFSRVAQFALRQSGISPTVVEEKRFITQREKFRYEMKKDMSDRPSTTVRRKNALAKVVEELETGSSKRVPALKGLSLREVRRHLTKTGFEYEVFGSGLVYQTNPDAGNQLKEKQVLKVYLQ
jgi:cell division protein FtsI (penicillin-binding protein 3)